MSQYHLSNVQHQHQPQASPTTPSPASSLPPQQPQQKSPGARHKAGSKLQIPNQKIAHHNLFDCNTNIDRRTMPYSAKELSPLAGSNRGPQDNE
jgi:hypothetical protein